MQKKIAIALVPIAVLGLGIVGFFLLQRETPEPAPVREERERGPGREVIGTSVQGRAIEAYTYGQGGAHLLFVGGIHGGYEWNSVLLAREFMDYFEKSPEFIPRNLQVSVIPNANPDGAQKGMGVAEARFNAKGVDLNRNFDCKWQPESAWRQQVVSAGAAPFSEPEAAAIRDFVLKHEPDAVVFWHSQANAVYASECEDGVLPETLDLMNAYAGAAGYRAVELFDHYEITGDAEGWLASIGIPAITVELSTRETIDWERNKAGVEALLEYYAI